jgi:putative addiction module killer protein
MAVYEVRHYCTADGADVFGAWFDGLRDPRAQERIAVRIDRLALGLFGDAKLLREGDGVRELRIDYGPGYRVYYALAGRTVVLLLCGGDKRTQRADIARVVRYWVEFQGKRR